MDTSAARNAIFQRIRQAQGRPEQVADAGFAGVGAEGGEAIELGHQHSFNLGNVGPRS